MKTRTFNDLITDLRQRRIAGEAPPVLLLGAGASAESGIGAMPDVYRFFGCSDFGEFARIIETYTPDERYRNLYQFLQTRDPSQITPGYSALASLCAAAYFDLVLTTNFDPLMDDALAAAQLWRKDYLLLVNTVIRNDWLARVLPERQPRVKIIKLHGDLFHRAMAWTVKEMDSFLDAINPVLAQAIKGRDVLVVGQSLRDRRIRDLVMNNARTIWYTHPDKVPDHLKGDNRVRAVIDRNCKFESLFSLLAQRLEVAVAPRQAAVSRAASPQSVPHAPAPGAHTMDDLMASVVAIEGPGGIKMCTGFVLAEPRVIVTDGYPIASLYPAGGNEPTVLTVVTADGKKYHDAIVHRDPSHPFGVVLIEAFENVKKFPGLRLSTTRPKAGTPVHIGVAAGERVGVSSGHIQDAREHEIDVRPVGRVPHLIAIDSQVAAGSSGAPVVDADLSVRGYIVAGGDRPPAFMYPSYRWAARLRAIQPGSGRGLPKGRRPAKPTRRKSAVRSRRG
jgi:S1-C subfamily serine protease